MVKLLLRSPLITSDDNLFFFIHLTSLIWKQNLHELMWTFFYILRDLCKNEFH